MRRLQDRMLAPEKRKLVRLLTVYLKDIGAKKRGASRHFGYPYVLETKVGPQGGCIAA